MAMNRSPTPLGLRAMRGSVMVCLATALFELAPVGPAYSREARPKIRSCTGICASQTYPNRVTGYDGQVYGPRSGGEGPLNASGSYGAMLEGRNPVGSTGF
jgi:hypothetical protein